MEFEIIGDPGPPSTDCPRALTAEERSQMDGLTRLAQIKLHRQFTHSTLGAAVQAIDAIRAEA